MPWGNPADGPAAPPVHPATLILGLVKIVILLQD
jgi:hypothetical protein